MLNRVVFFLTTLKPGEFVRSVNTELRLSVGVFASPRFTREGCCSGPRRSSRFFSTISCSCAPAIR